MERKDPKTGADRLLYEKGLLRVLERFGRVYVTGSYQMDLMVWNDLDVSIEHPDAPPSLLFELGSAVNGLLRPYRFEGSCKPGQSMFYGCETEITGERWNLDVWFREETEILKTRAYCDEIRGWVEREPEVGTAIREIKEELIRMGLYGMDKSPAKHYHSKEIYDAVLEQGVRSCFDFLKRYPK